MGRVQFHIFRNASSLLCSGNNWSYGLRIHANDDRSRGSAASSASVSTSSSMKKYDVYRRWEDCIYLQDTLEQQYAVLARERRVRLMRGKGVKKNGVYLSEDPLGRLHRAASFESLPPGPDPHTVARELRGILPPLSRKGTIFRASPATIEQRGEEFRQLIDALMREGDDVPALVVELRNLRVIRDFFGFWRRDHDRVEKVKSLEKQHEKDKDKDRLRAGSDPARGVFGGSPFGMYFSASNLSLQLPTSMSNDAPLPTQEIHVPVDKPPRRNTSPALRPPTHLLSSYASVDTLSSASTSTSSHPSARSSVLQHLDHRSQVQQPPTSAPPGSEFSFATSSSSQNGAHRHGKESDGYLSEPQTRSPRAAWRGLRPPPSPRSPPTGVLPQPHNISPHPSPTSNTFGAKINGQGHVNGHDRAVIPILSHSPLHRPQTTSALHDQTSRESQISLNDFPPDDADDIVVLAHEHLMPHGLDPLFEAQERRNEKIRRSVLASMIEEEEDNVLEGRRAVNGNSNIPKVIDIVHEQEVPLKVPVRDEDDEAAFAHVSPPIPRTPRTDRPADVPAANRNGLIFLSPAISAAPDDDDDVSSFGGHSRGSVQSRYSGYAPSMEAGDRRDSGFAQHGHAKRLAHIDSSVAISGSSGPASTSSLYTRSASPATSRFFFSPGQSSRRASWASSISPSYVSSTDAAPLMPQGRPVSTLSTMTSSADLESERASSPVLLHSPLCEPPQDRMHGVAHSTLSNRLDDTGSSVRSFVTAESTDAFAPYPSVPTVTTAAQLHLRAAAAVSGLKRSFSSGSRRPNTKRHSDASALSVTGESNESWAEKGDELLDSYFCSSPINGDENAANAPVSPGREHVRGSLALPDHFPKPFRNRPPGQFHLPWTPTATPALSARASVLSMTPSSTPTSSSHDDSIAIKAVYGDSIVAFKTDRSATLADVRTRVHEKLSKEQGIPVASAFTLAYRPALPSVRQSVASGRARSSSVSSVGVKEPGHLRYIFSPVEWHEAIATSGTKLTLQVLDNLK
ncbi:hypothetical protein BD410DRAFT_604337 [Rickenella mellea]|uniref:PX domain-containing protein n=1 Tax=Rickenella mellea TaxID=50990 RepID=A0A4Y7QDC1_9AGAM|nr:hypothetical protein BD410DRAFT_604337 [Rickenella mellea]